MAGRPSKPRQQKERQGTLNERKGVQKITLQPLTELPKAPDKFNEDEKWFYNMACEALFNSNMLTAPNLVTIESMAGWWYIMRMAQDDIRNNGLYQIAKTGWIGIAPSISAFKEAWAKLKDFTDRYGWSPLSKDKIIMPKKQSDELSEILNG